MTAPLFLVPAGGLVGLGPGRRLVLDGPEGHHAATVLRLGPGEEVLVADGAGARVAATVRAVGPGAVTLEVTAAGTEPAPQPRFVLVQALAKGGRDEDAIAAATELGVDEVVPWQSERAIVRWRGPKVDKGLEKWRSVVAAAGKQSRRARSVVVGDLVSTAQLAQRLGRPGCTAFVLHEAATDPLATAELPAEGEVVLVVGPEGGISPTELETLVAAGATPVRLGTTVLRSGTAGPAALAVLSARSRWR